MDSLAPAPAAGRLIACRPWGVATRTFLDRFMDAYPRELAAFADAVRHGSEVAVTGEDGLAAVVLANAAQRSLETNATVRLRREHREGRLRYGTRPCCP